jgi:hypothetical protein
MAIKEIIREELGNSKRMEKGYESALKKLPRGNLIKKKINGHEYWYLQVREGKKVRFNYVKDPSAAMILKHREAKESRVKYRTLLSQVRRQIKFLERIVRGRQAI